MEIYPVPAIGESGVYTLLPPFQNEIPSGVRMTCMSVRKISDYLAQNEDPYKLYYAPKDISKDEYDADSLSNMVIVGLQATIGNWIYVPARYLARYPDGSGKLYRGVSLVAVLPPTAMEFDFTSVKEGVVKTLKELMGVEKVHIREVENTRPVQIDSDKAQVLENSRLAERLKHSSYEARMLQLQNLVDAQKRHIAELEAYILNNAK